MHTSKETCPPPQPTPPIATPSKPLNQDDLDEYKTEHCNGGSENRILFYFILFYGYQYDTADSESETNVRLGSDYIFVSPGEPAMAVRRSVITSNNEVT